MLGGEILAASLISAMEGGTAMFLSNQKAHGHFSKGLQRYQFRMFVLSSCH